jgi:hypothetical protein
MFDVKRVHSGLHILDYLNAHLKDGRVMPAYVD